MEARQLSPKFSLVLFLVPFVGLAGLLLFGFLSQGEKITFHQWDEQNKRWILTEMTVSRRHGTNYQGAISKVSFEWEDPRDPNRDKYPNDDCEWGLPTSKEHFRAYAPSNNPLSFDPDTFDKNRSHS